MGGKSIKIDARSNRSSAVEFVHNISQYSFTSILIHLLIIFYLQKKRKE